jgi:hypothetical protein
LHAVLLEPVCGVTIIDCVEVGIAGWAAGEEVLVATGWFVTVTKGLDCIIVGIDVGANSAATVVVGTGLGVGAGVNGIEQASVAISKTKNTMNMGDTLVIYPPSIF